MSRIDPSKIIPTSVDTAEQWIEWHKSLKKWFSKTETNNHWLRFWNQRGGAGTQADTHDLRSYMSDQGVNLTTDTSGVVTDTVLNAVDWVGDSFSWARGIILGGVIIGIGLIAFYIYQQTKNGKSASEMSLGMPNGRKKELLKFLV